MFDHGVAIFQSFWPDAKTDAQQSADGALHRTKKNRVDLIDAFVDLSKAHRW
jgi:hypothetical protein